MSLPARKEQTRELTEMQRSFLDHLFSEECRGNVRKAMDAAGYSKTTPTSVVISSLSDEISELAQRVVATESGQAVFALFDILQNPNSLGASNKLKAAREILDRAGVTKKSDDLSVKIPQGGIVILPAKQAPVIEGDFIEVINED